MVNRKSKRALLMALSISLSLGWLTSTPSALASAVDEDTGETGSVTVHRAQKAAEDFMSKADFVHARDEYLRAANMAPDYIKLWEGLCAAAMKCNDWQAAANALDKIFVIEPKFKDFYAYEYGTTLYHLGRYDESETWLKRALAAVDSGAFASAPERPKPKQIGEKGVYKEQVLTKIEPPPPRKNITIDPLDTYLFNFENALRSESILIAEYEGYDKSADIHWNHPPRADYHIDKILKGPPLNKALPIRYVFHDPMVDKPPADWKFDPAKMMPKPGSKWLIFIEHAVPKNLEFDTFEGSYGRQPASEENLNKIYDLLEKHNQF